MSQREPALVQGTPLPPSTFCASDAEGLFGLGISFRKAPQGGSGAGLRSDFEES